MSSQANRRVLTVLLVFGAVVFGMVLSGSLNLTTPGATDTETEPAQGAVASEAPAPSRLRARV